MGAMNHPAMKQRPIYRAFWLDFIENIADIGIYPASICSRENYPAVMVHTLRFIFGISV